MDIANGDEGVDALDFVKDIRKQSSIDIDTAFTELMGKEWAKIKLPSYSRKVSIEIQRTPHTASIPQLQESLCINFAIINRMLAVGKILKRISNINIIPVISNYIHKVKKRLSYS